MKMQMCLLLLCACLLPASTVHAAVLTKNTAVSSQNESGPAAGGWVQEGERWWYRNADGTYPVSEWKQIRGKWYHFDEEGFMQTGLIQTDGGVYFCDPDGAMVTDTTMEINGLTYKFDEEGIADVSSMYKQPTYIPPDNEMTELMKTDAAMADQILSQIINDGMTQTQKAQAIYSWVRGHLSYGVSGTVGDWPQAAYEGLRRKRGNCYTYYATSLILLSRAGIPSVEVIRSKDHDHWWNLVYVDGAWYHFDTTPRRLGGNFCLLTTAQLMNYSNSHGNSHIFDQSLYPPTP